MSFFTQSKNKNQSHNKNTLIQPIDVKRLERLEIDLISPKTASTNHHVDEFLYLSKVDAHFDEIIKNENQKLD